MHGNSVLPLTPVTIGLLSYYTAGALAALRRMEVLTGSQGRAPCRH